MKIRFFPMTYIIFFYIPPPPPPPRAHLQHMYQIHVESDAFADAKFSFILVIKVYLKLIVIEIFKSPNSTKSGIQSNPHEFHEQGYKGREK